ncbi:hypothetical protein V8E36_004074 [Tilletia maclaganii]
MQLTTFATTVTLLSLTAVGASNAASNNTITCRSTTDFTSSPLTIRKLLTEAKPKRIAASTNHKSRDRLIIPSSSDVPTRRWAFETCSGNGIPVAKGTFFGRLRDTITGNCASLDAFPTGSRRQVVWEKACKKDASEALLQLFSYSPDSREIRFAGDIPFAGSKGTYVFLVNKDTYLPKYPVDEIAVRRVDTESGKHYIVKRSNA